MANGITELTELIPVITSAKIYEELRNDVSSFANFFAKDYEGDISAKGQVVKINTIVAPEGEILADDKAQFSPSELQISQQSLTVDQIAVASVEITDLAQMQSLDFQNDLSQALAYAIRKKMEAAILAALLPSTSAPDHDVAPAAASALAAIDFGTARTLLSTALVPVTDRKAFLAPSYYGDILNSTNVVSADFVSGNSAQSGVASKFMGFEISEHNLLSADVAYFAHKSALNIAMQKGVTVKVSDLHVQRKLGYLVSAHMIYGLKLCDNKRLVKISG
jgi:Phage capsid protein